MLKILVISIVVQLTRKKRER